MRELSEAEVKLITYIGKEAFAFLLDLYKKSKEQGVNLEELLELAAAKNDVTIYSDPSTL